MDSLKVKLSGIIIETFNLPQNTKTNDLSSDNLEAWDSLGHLNLIMAIEELFDVRFSTAEIPELISFRAIENALSNK